MSGLKAVVDKKQVKKSINRLQRLKTWQLLILLIMSVVLSATFLRLNNIGMSERRAAVVNADTTGNDEVTKSRLVDLQNYVSAHMNTDMGKGVYLEASYKKDVKSIYDAASNDYNPNGNIYRKAQDVCAPKFTTWSTAYIQCTVNELAKYPASSNLIDSVELPDPNIYLHVFASPLWSPDFAGWSVLMSAAILTMIIARLTSVGLLKMMLKFRYKSI